MLVVLRLFILLVIKFVLEPISLVRLLIHVYVRVSISYFRVVSDYSFTCR